MRFPVSTAAALLLAASHHMQAAAQNVFAHFMVDNTEDYGSSSWKSDMSEAITAKIDAFALNIAAGRDINDAQIALAFSAAQEMGFKLFFSFDYAGNGAWAKADVLALLNEYAYNSAYFQHDGSMPLVSTFEGPASAADWIEIKATIGCFFIPDWSSVGAEAAVALEGGVADGLFSWAAWPWGGDEMDTYTDASYQIFLGDKPFMMAASPWFYTNMPGYDKNWMWPDPQLRLWAERWTEIMVLQPAYVEIISWNDYGESHYIGDVIGTPSYASNGVAEYDYITGMDHYPLRWPLQTWIQQYKTGVATITDESLVIQYLLNPISGCSDGDTPVNTHTQLQMEISASGALDYSWVGYIATLGSPGNVTVTVGGSSTVSEWIHEPAGGVGVYYGVAYIPDGTTGEVTATLIRDGTSSLSVTGSKEIGGCTDGYSNFNIFVAGEFGDTVSATTPYSISDQVCIRGTGANEFAAICQLVCEYGYCPSSACVCQDIGLQKTEPKITGDLGYAKSDPNFDGLCSWAYNHGYTFDDVCTTVDPGDLASLTYNPFLPETCTGGQFVRTDYGDGLNDLCGFLCTYSYCPLTHCVCTSTGLLNSLDDATIPDINNFITLPDANNEDQTLSDMCDFACGYGFCNCLDTTTDTAGDDTSETAPCDWSLSWDNLEALSYESSTNFPVYCFGAYTLAILSANLTSSIAAYPSVDDGYDDVFGYYQKYIKSMIEPSLDSFMYDDGYTYFTCAIGIKGSSTTSPVDCPSPNSATATDSTTYMVWTLNNATGFDAVLAANYGIESDWVEFDTITATVSCSVPITINPDGTTTNCLQTQEWRGYPQKASSVTVPNPKDFFTSAGPSLDTLPINIDATRMDIELGAWGGSTLDLVDVYTMPVAMASQAITAMQSVKSIGEQEKEEEMKNLIMIIVGAILAIVPFVGEEALAASGLAMAARAAAIAGEAANAAFDIYSIVEDPSSAAMTIFGMLLGAGGVAASLRDEQSFADMASLRRGMSTDDLASLGGSVESETTLVNKIVRSCKA